MLAINYRCMRLAQGTRTRISRPPPIPHNNHRLLGMCPAATRVALPRVRVPAWAVGMGLLQAGVHGWTLVHQLLARGWVRLAHQVVGRLVGGRVEVRAGLWDGLLVGFHGLGGQVGRALLYIGVHLIIIL